MSFTRFIHFNEDFCISELYFQDVKCVILGSYLVIRSLRCHREYFIDNPVISIKNQKYNLHLGRGWGVGEKLAAVHVLRSTGDNPNTRSGVYVYKSTILNVYMYV